MCLTLPCCWQMKRPLQPLHRRSRKTHSFAVRSMEYADDINLVVADRQELSLAITDLDTRLQRGGMSINASLTCWVILIQQVNEASSPPPIYLSGTQLQEVEHFKYLGSIVARGGSLDEEIAQRTAAASRTFYAFARKVWHNRSLSLQTKIMFYKAAILPVLLYGAEAWNTMQRHTRRLETFHLKCMRRILGIKWQDKRSNLHVRGRTLELHIGTLVEAARLRWLGHVCRMDDGRLAKDLLFGELESGKRARGGPKKRWKDCVLADLNTFGFGPRWTVDATDRKGWRRAVGLGKEKAESSKAARDRIVAARRLAAQSAPSAFPCTQRGCHKVCLSNRGLQIHIKAKHQDRVGGRGAGRGADRGRGDTRGGAEVTTTSVTRTRRTTIATVVTRGGRGRGRGNGSRGGRGRGSLTD
eukprot:GHVS01005958.1.p1 GENE.GHVS01005958.1~~GHVS01005958.1.p1  ORF type:complete len:414 (+),score=32.94 GHVS01005958.1:49-1290(+)